MLESKGDLETLILGESGVDTSQLVTARDNSCLPILGPQYRFQQHQLGNPVQKCEEWAAVVGNGGKGVGEGGIDGAGTGNNVQGGGKDGVDLWDW